VNLGTNSAVTQFVQLVIDGSALSFRPAGKPSKAWLLATSLALVGAVALSSHPAAADKRSALLTVSVQVVESCRVETSGAAGNSAIDLKLRCSSTARPNVSLASDARAIAPVGTVSLPHYQSATSENGPTLNIEF
jgi:hypothetical protein